MQAHSSRFRVSPLPRPEFTDRRKKRSTAAGEALQLALNRAAERGALDVVAVADEEGMLVANSRTPLDLSMLAAILPLVGRGQISAAIKRKGEPRDLTVEPMELCNERLFVAALGGDMHGRKREVASSAAAARRILG